MSDHTPTINDHLYIAYGLAKQEFWFVHNALNSEYENSSDQLKDVKELARLGNLMMKIIEARQAI